MVTMMARVMGMVRALCSRSSTVNKKFFTDHNPKAHHIGPSISNIMVPDSIAQVDLKIVLVST